MNSTESIRIVREIETGNNNSILLVTNGEQFAVIQWDNRGCQVMGPHSSGNTLVHRGRTPEAINYVASWVSKRTADKRLAEATADLELDA